MARSEIENPIIEDVIRPWPRQSYQYIAPRLTCGCDRQAVYMVDGQPHCKSCMYDAVDSTEYVKVKRL